MAYWGKAVLKQGRQWKAIGKRLKTYHMLYTDKYTVNTDRNKDWEMSVKVLSCPGRSYPRKIRSRATGLNCRSWRHFTSDPRSWKTRRIFLDQRWNVFKHLQSSSFCLLNELFLDTYLQRPFVRLGSAFFSVALAVSRIPSILTTLPKLFSIALVTIFIEQRDQSFSVTCWTEPNWSLSFLPNDHLGRT